MHPGADVGGEKPVERPRHPASDEAASHAARIQAASANADQAVSHKRWGMHKEGGRGRAGAAGATSSTRTARGAAGSSGAGSARAGAASGYRPVTRSAYAVVCAAEPIAYAAASRIPRGIRPRTRQANQRDRDGDHEAPGPERGKGREDGRSGERRRQHEGGDREHEAHRGPEPPLLRRRIDLDVDRVAPVAAEAG